jgi:hypothetical protein
MARAYRGENIFIVCPVARMSRLADSRTIGVQGRSGIQVRDTQRVHPCMLDDRVLRSTVPVSDARPPLPTLV